MKKFLKWISAVAVALVLLIALAITLLMTLVSPNRLKPVLTAQVMKYTSRVLTIDGDLSWSFFPYLGVKVGHMSLGNPATFQQKTFAEIKSATVGVKLMPLLHGKIESSGILLDGMKLNLVKNAAGQVNWSFQPAAAKKTTTDADTTTTKSGAAIGGLAVSTLDIENTSVNYSDEQQHQAYAVTDFSLHAKNINLMKPFPLNTAFDFAAQKQAVSGHATLSGDAALNLTTQIYSFRNAEFTAKINQGGKKINVSFTGNLLTNLNDQTLQWTDFKGQVENISLTGKMNVTQLTTNPVARGDMQILPFDLKTTLEKIGQPAANLQAAKDVSGNVNFSASAKAVDVKSHLQIDTLQAAKITMKNFVVEAHLQDGVLDLAPFTANLYEGKLNGSAKVNLNTPDMPVSAQAKLSSIQAEPLMQDLAGKDQKLKIAGVGNVDVNVTTKGADAVRNLNGTSNFSFNNGALLGLDLGYMVDTAYALARQKSPSATDNKRTNFGNLTGSAVIRNGVVTNNDLLSDSPRFLTKGQGTINLVTQQIDYQLQTSLKQRSDGDDAKNLYGINIPVLITGNLSSPSIRLDSGAIVKAVAQQQIQKVTDKAKEKIEEKLKDQVGQQAGELLNGLLKR